MELEQVQTILCDHCHNPCEQVDLIKTNDNNFCCHGCKTVYSIINNNHLGEYYQIRDAEDLKFSKVKEASADFDYMDNEQFLEEFTSQDKNIFKIKFFIEGIHCMACLWLIEKTPTMIKGLKSARLNLTDNTAIFEFDKTLKLSTLAQTLTQLGYIPHVLKLDESSKSFQNNENRKDILRIGLAAAAMMNIMLYAISNYAGAQGSYRVVFNWISLVFALPVVFYSATPIYKSALSAFKMGSISIDTPLSLAIILGSALSFYSLINGGDHLYFDTITTLIFLILLSRYFVKIATLNGLSTTGAQTFFINKGVKRVNNGQVEKIHSKYINIGDKVIIDSGERIVFDGILDSQKTIVDNSIITGESKPINIEKGQELFAGSINLDEEIVITVNKTSEQTRVAKMLREIEAIDGGSSKFVQRADKISKYFISIILILTTVIFTHSYITAGFYLAVTKALSIIIISCPCALALATPLAYIKGLTHLKSFGVFVKNEKILEQISTIKNIILDKTGTITEGSFKVRHYENNGIISDHDIMSLTYTLESISRHPIAHALKEFSRKQNASKYDVTEAKEIINLGVSALYNQKSVEIRKVKLNDRTQNTLNEVGLYLEDRLAARFLLGDVLKVDTQDTLSKLSKIATLHLVSGDHTQIVNDTIKDLPIAPIHAHGDKSPEEKSRLISNIEDSLMIGDGANDALALKKADIGVAVGGAVDISLRASDIFLTSPNLNFIYLLMIISKETKKVVVRNMGFSLFYNIVGISLAVNGFITPLTAAIFMPISSITVLVSSVIGTKTMRKTLRNMRGIM